MFYVDVDNRCFKGEKPEFTVTETAVLELAFVRADGSTPFDLAGIRLALAVDDNFRHDDELTAYAAGDAVTITDASNGRAAITVKGNSAKFASLTQRGRALAALEIVAYRSGSAEGETLARAERVVLHPRVHTTEGAPEPADPEYYNAAQVDSLLAGIAVPLGPCAGLGRETVPGGLSLAWVDPDDVTVNGTVLSSWDRTVLVRKEGAYPAGPEDGTLVAETSRSAGTRNAYRGGFVDAAEVPEVGFFYQLFSRSGSGRWNALEANRFTASTGLSWGQIQADVRAGRGAELYPVGTVFAVDHDEYAHTDGTGLWFRVVGHDQVPAADGTLTHTMCLDMVDCLFTTPYDAPELAYAPTADTVALEGKNYYTLDNGSYTLLVAGTDYTVGSAVTGMWYEKNLDNRSVYGSNNPAENGLLQWANSAGAANRWFRKQTIFDLCPADLLGRNGFVRGLDPLFAAAVQPASLTTAVSTAEGGNSIVHTAKFWFLSITQTNGSNNNNIAENIRLSFYADGGSRIKKTINTETAVNWWMRSPNTASTYSEHNMQTNGNANRNSVSNSYGFSPACIIA